MGGTDSVPPPPPVVASHCRSSAALLAPLACPSPPPPTVTPAEGGSLVAPLDACSRRLRGGCLGTALGSDAATSDDEGSEKGVETTTGEVVPSPCLWVTFPAKRLRNSLLMAAFPLFEHSHSSNRFV